MLFITFLYVFVKKKCDGICGLFCVFDHRFHDIYKHFRPKFMYFIPSIFGVFLWIPSAKNSMILVIFPFPIAFPLPYSLIRPFPLSFPFLSIIFISPSVNQSIHRFLTGLKWRITGSITANVCRICCSAQACHKNPPAQASLPN